MWTVNQSCSNSPRSTTFFRNSTAFGWASTAVALLRRGNRTPLPKPSCERRVPRPHGQCALHETRAFELLQPPTRLFGVNVRAFTLVDETPNVEVACEHDDRRRLGQFSVG